MAGNSEAGSLVDSLLINHPFVTMDRWRLQIRSQAGIIPGIEFPGTIDVDGQTVRVDLMPGFVKMALGTGHLVFRDNWSRGGGCRSNAGCHQGA